MGIIDHRAHREIKKLVYPQTCPVKFFAEDERSGFNWGYADYTD
jgi:hypothetical protein